ncbi:MAG: hypothetical protein ACREUG_06725, partial [Steroidobacteraceae bacterium]
MNAPLDRAARNRPASGGVAEDPARVEARLQTTVWGTGIGLWEIDFQHDRTRWFGDWCDRLGLDPCDGRDHVARWDAHLHPDDLDEASR